MFATHFKRGDHVGCRLRRKASVLAMHFKRGNQVWVSFKKEGKRVRDAL